MERGLADEYREHIRIALDHLASALPDERDDAYERVVAALALAGSVRGFDEVKEANVDSWRADAADALGRLARQATPQTV